MLLLLGLAVTVLYTDAGQLVPALQSYWLWIHVTAAIIAAGVFTLGVASAVPALQTARSRARAQWTYAGRGPSRCPPRSSWTGSAYRTHVFAFPIWTFAVIAGAIWAENAWGRYWGWDPKETWAFITWVVYAAATCTPARPPAGAGAEAGGLALLGFAAMMFNLFGVNILVTGLHSYAGV